MSDQNELEVNPILQHAVQILDDLGPFLKDTERTAKWRTADQLASEISTKLGRQVQPEEVDEVLLAAHKEAMEACAKGKEPSAKVRHALRPDLTTAKRLWGSTTHLGQVWPAFPSDERLDEFTRYYDALKPIGEGHRVFLSYSHADGECPLQLAQKISELGIDVWMADVRIQAGANIVDRIGKALFESDALVGFVTGNMIASLWCRTELETALASRHPPSYMVINTSDPVLMEMLQHATFSRNEATRECAGKFDESHIRAVGQKISKPLDNAETFTQRAHEFALRLPSYLGGNPAFAFPEMPQRWDGPFELKPLQMIQKDFSA